MSFLDVHAIWIIARNIRYYKLFSGRKFFFYLNRTTIDRTQCNGSCFYVFSIPDKYLSSIVINNSNRIERNDIVSPLERNSYVNKGSDINRRFFIYRYFYCIICRTVCHRRHFTYLPSNYRILIRELNLLSYSNILSFISCYFYLNFFSLRNHLYKWRSRRNLLSRINHNLCDNSFYRSIDGKLSQIKLCFLVGNL